MNRLVQINITIEPDGLTPRLISHVLLPDDTGEQVAEKVTALVTQAVTEAQRLRQPAPATQVL